MSSSQFFQSFVLPVTTVTATAGTSTSSSTFAVISTMTLTPVQGNYLAIFSGSLDISSDDEGEIAIFLGGTQQTHTTREVRVAATGLLGALAEMTIAGGTVAYLTVDGTQAIDVRFRAVSGTLTAEERSLTLVQIP